MKMYLTAAAAVIILGAVIWYLEGGTPVGPEGTSGTEQEQTSPQGEQKQNETARPRSTAATPTSAAPTPSVPAEPTPQIAYDNASEKDVFIVLPKPGQTVSPSIVVSGTARGTWFYQGSFVAEVIAKNGDVLVRAMIPAKGNSMTTEMVQFSTTVFTNSAYRGPATVVLRSDMPPGHPYPDGSVSIPVTIE